MHVTYNCCYSCLEQVLNRSAHVLNTQVTTGYFVQCSIALYAFIKLFDRH
jgi:hypothetical protein